MISGCDGEADVVFLLDSSSSTSETEFAETCNFISSQLINEFQISEDKTRIGIIADSTSVITLYLNSIYDASSIIQTVQSLPYRNTPQDFEASMKNLYDIFDENKGMRDDVPRPSGPTQ